MRSGSLIPLPVIHYAVGRLVFSMALVPGGFHRTKLYSFHVLGGVHRVRACSCRKVRGSRAQILWEDRLCIDLTLDSMREVIVYKVDICVGCQWEVL